jgi:acid stress-induced BolA-like protein IbaG/YrbA
VDLKEKVAEALKQRLHPDHVQLDDDDGISGIVVASQFRGMSALDRQIAIDEALRSATPRLSKPELRQVLAIAALTPVEFAGVQARRIGG